MSLPNDVRPLHLLLFVVVIVAAAGLRLPGLALRPMHTDEAVHAIKFGEILAGEGYHYDPVEYHGPTLNYLTRVPAWIAGANRLADLDEAMLRIVPAVFGVGIVVLLALFWPGMGGGAILFAALLTAVSPAMVFYSRYYIQETLLVFFSLALIAAGYRYGRAPSVGWALAAGAGLGLMHATKETAVLAVVAMLLAWGAVRVSRRTEPSGAEQASRPEWIPHALLAAAVAISVSAILYSSFLSNPRGVVDSYGTYLNYLGKAGADGVHVQPWYYYLRMLAYFRLPPGPVWTEALVLVLAFIGVGAVATGRRIPGIDRDLSRFFAVYGPALLVMYSLIPYKTPWSMLGALHGLILLAGIGAVVLLDLAGGRAAGLAALMVLLLLCAHLTVQSYRSTHGYRADPSNPYVYSHPGEDVLRIAERVQAFADVHPRGNAVHVEVVSPGSDYWPLPWYLRRFPRIGWWETVDMETPAAPLILAAPSVEDDLLRKLYEVPPPGERRLYVPLFDTYREIRPTVEIRGYVSKELRDAFDRRSAEAAAGGPAR